MKKIIFLILLLFVFISCTDENKGYEELENGLVALLDEKQQQDVMKYFNSAAKYGNLEVYETTYLYYGDTEEDFFIKYLNKSKGHAEYYKALIMLYDKEEDGEIIKILEKSAKQGNKRAYNLIGEIHEKNLEFSTAQKSFKKGKEADEIYSIYSYEYSNNIISIYKKIEDLNQRLLTKTITTDEKKELGTLLLENYANYEVSYNILKEFLPEEYPPALYAKAKLLEGEGKSDEALGIYRDLFFKSKYYLTGFEISMRIVNESQNYDLALKVLDDIETENSLIDGYMGFIYEAKKDNNNAEKYYQKAVKKNDVDAMAYLAKFYEVNGSLEKAKDMYEKAYNKGSILAGYQLAYVLERLSSEDPKKEQVELGKNAKSKDILKKLAYSGDNYANVDLSMYYDINSTMVRNINLKSAVKGYPVAYYNLGVYYFVKKNNKKASYWFKKAKDSGYEIDDEYVKLL